MPRSYDSSVRSERVLENRQRIISAAHALFLSNGWTATTMTQVASAAALARPTMYLHFQTKLELLIACIDSALSDVPVRNRSDYRAMAQGTLPQRAATAAQWLRRAYERSAAIQRVLDDAATSNPDAAVKQTQMEQRRHDEFGNACQLVLGDRTPPKSLVDEVWALGSRDVWFALADRGWSPNDWETWFVRLILDAVARHDLEH